MQRVIVQARARSVADAQKLDGDTHMTIRWP